MIALLGIALSLGSASAQEENVSSSSLLLEPQIVAETLTGATRDSVTPVVSSGVMPSVSFTKTPDLGTREEFEEDIVASITEPNGAPLTADVSVTEESDSFTVHFIAPTSFTPGWYAIDVSLGSRTLYQKNHFLGRGAINLAQDEIPVGAVMDGKASFLQDDGTLACGDPITLSIGGESLQTSFAECEQSGMHFTLSGIDEGSHTLDVSADSWIFRQELTIGVAERAASISRNGPNHMDAGDEETMDITVTPVRDFTGTISDSVPKGWTIASTEDAAAVVETTDDGGTSIIWTGTWKAHQTSVLRYTLKAEPASTPLLGRVGPLVIHGTWNDNETGEVVPAPVEESAPAEPAENSDSTLSALRGLFASIMTVVSSGTHRVLAWLGQMDAQSFIASLVTGLSGESGVFEQTENRTWNILVPVGSPATDGSATEPQATVNDVMPDNTEPTLQLTAAAPAFDANAQPTFTLLDGTLPSLELDTDGVIKTEDALSAIAKAVISKEDIEHSLLTEIIRQERYSIAEEVLSASENAADITQAAEEARMDTVRSLVSERIERSEDLAASLAGVLDEEADATLDLSFTVTEELTDRLAESIAAASAGGTEDVRQAIREGLAPVTTSQSADLYGVKQDIIEAITDSPEAVDVIVEAMKGNTEETSETSAPLISVTMTDRNGQVFMPDFHFEEGSVLLVIEPLRHFVPGLYTLTVTITNPLSGEQQTFTQNFTWGVLAMNANKDRYQPGDRAHLAFGVLDDLGEIVCDASLTLTVREPSGHILTYSTSDASITVTGSCGLKQAGMIDPDYETYLTFTQNGTYELTLEATTANGTRSMTSEITVASGAPFTVERTAATRLWPFAPSPMDISVTFHEAYSGTVEEIVPSDFIVNGLEPDATVTERDDGTAVIRWNGSWDAGEKEEFRYVYDAPNISPYFYLMGPLMTESGTEDRTWQIANDATNLKIIGVVYGSSTPGPLSGMDVSASLNGGTPVTAISATTSTGMYTITGLTMTAGTIVAVFIDNETENGVTVTLGSGGNIIPRSNVTTLNIYQNNLTVRSESGSDPLTWNDLIISDNSGDTDISAIYAFTGNDITISSAQLRVEQGEEFALEGELAASGVHVGTGSTLHYRDKAYNPAGLTMRSSAILKLTGDQDLDPTTRSVHEDALVEYRRQTGTGGINTDFTYGSVKLTSTGYAGFRVSGSTLNMTNSLTISGGTLKIDNGQRINLSGSWLLDRTASTAEFKAGTGLVMFNGFGQTITGTTYFYNLSKIIP